IKEIAFEMPIMLQMAEKDQTLFSWSIKWSYASEKNSIEKFVMWYKYFLEAILRSIIKENQLNKETPHQEQQCVNCQEIIKIQPKKDPFYVYCPKCNYPQLPY
ncbi:MAG: hypothetical protein ACFFD1_14895, partial [Candidatus Thorarchaeota archaeon]